MAKRKPKPTDKPAAPVATETPAAETPAETPAAETPAAETPQEAKYQRPAVLDKLIQGMPETTVKGAKVTPLAPQVIDRAKLEMANEEGILKYADGACFVLGLASRDVFILALDGALQAEHDAAIAKVRAERAREEAQRRLKVRETLDKGIKEAGVAKLITPALMEMVNAAHKEGMFIVIHGPLMSEGEQPQGSGIFLRDKGTPAAARAPRAAGASGGNGGKEGGRASFEYFDEAKGIQVTIPLARYLRETYPGEHAAVKLEKMEADLKSGASTTRYSAWVVAIEGEDKHGSTHRIKRRVSGSGAPWGRE